MWTYLADFSGSFPKSTAWISCNPDSYLWVFTSLTLNLSCFLGNPEKVIRKKSETKNLIPQIREFQPVLVTRLVASWRLSFSNEKKNCCLRCLADTCLVFHPTFKLRRSFCHSIGKHVLRLLPVMVSTWWWSAGCWSRCWGTQQLTFPTQEEEQTSPSVWAVGAWQASLAMR